MPGWVFDRDYEDSSDPSCGDYEYDEVVFRMTNGDEEMFLYLHNTHNGYYSHGWEVKVNDKEVDCGRL